MENIKELAEFLAETLRGEYDIDTESNKTMYDTIYNCLKVFKPKSNVLPLKKFDVQISMKFEVEALNSEYAKVVAQSEVEKYADGNSDEFFYAANLDGTQIVTITEKN